MVSSALRFARELELDRADRRLPGRAHPRDAGARARPARPPARPHAAQRRVARDVVVWTRAQGLDPHLNHLERFIVRADDPRADDYTRFMGSHARARGRPGRRRSATRSRRSWRTASRRCRPRSPPLARARFAGRADVTVSHPHFIEFVAPGVSKGRAVRWLARRLGVPLGAVLAIGDQWNDIEMLAEVGHGTAMPTAPTEVQAVARYIAPPLAEEGVARMIEALVLARPATPGGRGATEAEAAATARRRRSDRRAASRHDGPHRDRRRGRARARRSRSCGPAGRRAPDRHGLRDRRRARHAGRHRAPVPGQAPAARTRGSCCSWTTRPRRRDRRDGPGRHGARRACWPGGLTVVVPQRPDVAAARRPDRRCPDDRPARPGPRRPAGAGARRRAAADHLGQCVRPPGGTRRGRDPRPARRRDRPHPRRWPGHGGPASTVVDCTGAAPASSASARSRSIASARSWTRRASCTSSKPEDAPTASVADAAVVAFGIDGHDGRRAAARRSSPRARRRVSSRSRPSHRHRPDRRRRAWLRC